jgi:hypothetical protein
MNRLLSAVALVCVLTCGSAWAQGTGVIALSATPDGTACGIVDVAAGFVDVHIVVLDVTDFSAIQFVAKKPDCWTDAVWVSEEINSLLWIGNTQDPVGGMSAAWGDCLDGPIYVGSIRYMTSGGAPACCDYEITKATSDHYPEIPGPIIAVCPDFHIAGVTANAVINPQPECSCLQALAVEESTWGHVKALYR